MKRDTLIEMLKDMGVKLDGVTRMVEVQPVTDEEGFGIEKRPWGWWKQVATHPWGWVKVICVYSGHRLSLQKHKHRDEHWLVAYGNARITLRGGSIQYENAQLLEGQSINIKAGEEHRLSNLDDSALFVVEIALGKCDEDDIERLEDDYERD